MMKCPLGLDRISLPERLELRSCDQKLEWMDGQAELSNRLLCATNS